MTLCECRMPSLLCRAYRLIPFLRELMRLSQNWYRSPVLACPLFFFHLATRVVTAISMEMAVRAISGGVAGPFWLPQLLPGHLPSFGGEIRRRLRRPRHFGLRTCHEECVRSRGSRRVAWGPRTITSLGVVAEAQPQPRGRLSSFGRDFGEKRPHGKAALQSGFAQARALAWWQCWTVSSHKRHQDVR